MLCVEFHFYIIFLNFQVDEFSTALQGKSASQCCEECYHGHFRPPAGLVNDSVFCLACLLIASSNSFLFHLLRLSTRVTLSNRTVSTLSAYDYEEMFVQNKQYWESVLSFLMAPSDWEETGNVFPRLEKCNVSLLLLWKLVPVQCVLLVPQFLCAAVASKRTLMNNIRMPEKFASLSSVTFLFFELWCRKKRSVGLALQWEHDYCRTAQSCERWVSRPNTQPSPKTNNNLPAWGGWKDTM